MFHEGPSPSTLKVIKYEGSPHLGFWEMLLYTALLFLSVTNDNSSYNENL